MWQMDDYGDEKFQSKITSALQEIMYIILESIDDNSTLKGALKRDEISHKFKNINTSDIKKDIWSEKALKLITLKYDFHIFQTKINFL